MESDKNGPEEINDMFFLFYFSFLKLIFSRFIFYIIYDKILKTQIFQNLKCCLRSYKVNFTFKNQLFLEIYFFKDLYSKLSQHDLKL